MNASSLVTVHLPSRHAPVITTRSRMPSLCHLSFVLLSIAFLSPSSFSFHLFSSTSPFPTKSFSLDSYGHRSVNVNTGSSAPLHTTQLELRAQETLSGISQNQQNRRQEETNGIYTFLTDYVYVIDFIKKKIYIHFRRLYLT